MRIVSKFSDYYDVGLSYGIDKSIFYERKLEHYNIELPVDIRSKTKDIDDFSFYFYRGVIGFCGEIYPFVFVKKYEKIKGNFLRNEKLLDSDFFYDKESMFLFINYSDEKNEFRYDYFGIDKLFDISDNDMNKLKAIFSELEKPIFSYCNIEFDDILVPDAIRMRNGLMINPILSKFKFYKVKEGVRAFQEISMYLGSLKHPEIETRDIDDKIVAKSKGFNCMSFKKQGKKEHKC